MDNGEHVSTMDETCRVVEPFGFEEGDAHAYESMIVDTDAMAIRDSK